MLKYKIHKHWNVKAAVAWAQEIKSKQVNSAL